MDITTALEAYNEAAELPRGYRVEYVNEGEFHTLMLRHNGRYLAYPVSALSAKEIYNHTINRDGLLLSRQLAWQDALENAPDTGVVASESGNIKVLLFSLPSQSKQHFASADISIRRGPITLFSPARNVSIGQIVAAICG